MLIRIVFLIMALTDGVLLHGMLSRRTVPVSRFSSAATKALAGGIPVIAPLSFSQRKSFYNAPEVNFSVAEKSFESSGGAGQGKTFWGRKAIPLLGLAAGFYKFGDVLMSKYQDKKALEEAKQLIFDNSDDLAVVDPEIYEVCLQIMKDYGIKENINFRVRHSNLNDKFEPDNSFEVFLKDFANTAHNFIPIDTIIFSPFYKVYSKPLLIKTIAHELEHTRQFHKYPGSYHGNFYNINDIRKLEQAADAAALDYQYCPECLFSHTLPSGPILAASPYEPEETEYGYFTSKKGYFAEPDYRLYANRNDCEFGDSSCLAHQYFQDAHTRRDIPLKDFLPTIKPSLPSVKFNTAEK